jgi:serine/threonine protein kinase
MLAGLNAFHTAGFFHGNCGASSFLLGDDGEPRLCGFSSAGILGREGTATRLNTVFGSVGYMPPEVIQGRKLHQFVEVTRPVAVDIFSLGVTFCFVLSNGKIPVRAETAMSQDENAAADDDGVQAIATLSPEGKHLVSLMLSTNPSSRRRNRHCRNRKKSSRKRKRRKRTCQTKVKNSMVSRESRKACHYIAVRRSIFHPCNSHGYHS